MYIVIPAAAPLHAEPEEQLDDLEVADARGQVEHRLPLRVPLVEVEGQLELKLACKLKAQNVDSRLALPKIS